MTITAPISRLLKYRILPTASRSSSGALLRPLRALRIRTFASEAKFDPESVERAQDEVDVCIVGGGPAGLSAAIRLKQLEQERGGDELRVVVLEKGGEVGEFQTSHDLRCILSTQFNRPLMCFFLSYRRPHPFWCCD